jgi:cyclopropane fatty-acyl-phospholipid synthase-like methyltransferase
MSNIPSKATFEQAYAGEAPWDIGQPQPEFVAIAHRITGSILDVGCGTGDNALFFAERGHQVTAIDYLAEPIARAKQKAAQRRVIVNWHVMNALALSQWAERYDNIIDCGLFHVFSDEDRRSYSAGLAHVLKSGGRLYLLCFSDEEPGTVGPRRVSKRELDEAFAHGWTLESIEPSAFAINPNFKDVQFSPGGPKAWFVVAKRA